MNAYVKDLNELKEQILKDGNTLVSKRDLLERFCEMDKEYNSEPWNLLQILANINVLIGEEPCEDCVSRQAVSDFLEGATNGEVVEKNFGKSIYYTLISMMYVSCCEKFDKWWDAPYKKN